MRISLACCFLLFCSISLSAQEIDTLGICIYPEVPKIEIDYMQNDLPETVIFANDDYKKGLELILEGFGQTPISANKKTEYTFDVCDENINLDEIFKKNSGITQIAENLGINTLKLNFKQKTKQQIIEEIKKYCKENDSTE